MQHQSRMPRQSPCTPSTRKALGGRERRDGRLCHPSLWVRGWKTLQSCAGKPTTTVSAIFGWSTQRRCKQRRCATSRQRCQHQGVVVHCRPTCARCVAKADLCWSELPDAGRLPSRPCRQPCRLLLEAMRLTRRTKERANGCMRRQQRLHGGECALRMSLCRAWLPLTFLRMTTLISSITTTIIVAMAMATATATTTGTLLQLPLLAATPACKDLPSMKGLLGPQTA